MKTNQNSAHSALVYCAGGIVWRHGETEREVLLIRSRSRAIWKLPKGHVKKRDAGWDAAALREVKEETGYEAVITGFAGFTTYPNKRGRTKVVFFWHMEAAAEQRCVIPEEIHQCAWVSARAALERLTYQRDRELLGQFVNEIKQGHEAQAEEEVEEI